MVLLVGEVHTQKAISTLLSAVFPPVGETETWLPELLTIIFVWFLSTAASAASLNNTTTYERGTAVFEDQVSHLRPVYELANSVNMVGRLNKAS
jgi:hypothetical protein